MNEKNEVHTASMTNPHKCKGCEELQKRVDYLTEVIISLQESLRRLAAE